MLASIVAIAISVVVTPVRPETATTQYIPAKLAMAAIVESTVFAFGAEKTNGWIAWVQSDLHANSKVHVYQPPTRTVEGGTTTRWKIGAGGCWFIDEFGTRRENPFPYSLYMFRLPVQGVRNRDYDSATSPENGFGAQIVHQQHTVLARASPFADLVLRDSDGRKRYDVHFDFIPRSESSADVYFHNGEQFHAFRMTAKWDPEKTIGNRRGRWVDDWKHVETFESKAFDGPFRIFDATKSRILVTDLGKAFIIRDVKEGRRKVEPLWSDDRQTITVLIADTKSGKTFAFTKPSDPKAKSTDAVFFELTDPIEPRRFDPAKLRMTTAPEPLHTALQHARFLVDQKLIDGK